MLARVLKKLPSLQFYPLRCKAIMQALLTGVQLKKTEFIKILNINTMQICARTFRKSKQMQPFLY